MVSTIRTDVAQHSALDKQMRYHIQSLEDRLEKNALRAEERSAIFAGRDQREREASPISTRDHPSRLSVKSQSSSSSSSAQENPAKRPFVKSAHAAVLQGRPVSKRNYYGVSLWQFSERSKLHRFQEESRQQKLRPTKPNQID
jgi:hypothetical protein